METENDISYGVIPLLEENAAWKVFLIHQYGSAGDVYWTFPKGHPETGEGPAEAAVRELEEETALTLKSLDEARSYTQEYTFRYENRLIHKKVVYFLGVVANPAYRIQEDEVKDAGWFSLEEAGPLLTYEPARIMFEKVVADLAHLKD